MATQVYGSTQDFLDIYDIKNDCVVLKTGKVAVVLQLNSINFDLLSAREQDAIISTYGEIINSLNFPIQIVIRSRAMNIEKYLLKLRSIEDKVVDPLLKVQAKAYREFVQKTIRVNKVLDKQFYLVIPSMVEHYENIGKNPFEFFYRLFGQQNKRSDSINPDELISLSKGDLTPKIDTMIRLFEKIRINAKRLNTVELVKLYYEIYKESSGKSSFSIPVDSYTTPIVEPNTV
jgi:hypothetical protein